MELNKFDQPGQKLHFTDPSWGSDLSGAYRAMCSIKDAATVFHSPAGCQGYVVGLVFQQVQHYGMTGSTALSERDVIFGGEEKLEQALIRTVEVYRPDMIAIIGSTVSRLIGDDVDGIANLVKREHALEIPIFALGTSSMEGDHITGHNMVLEALVENVMVEPKKKLEKTVNLFGLQEDSPYGIADAREVTRLLSRLGITVHVPFLCQVATHQIRDAAQASLNIVLSDNLGLTAARLMEREFGVPYISLDYPIGLTNTRTFLSKAADFFGIEVESVERVVETEMEQVYEALRAATYAVDVIQGLRAAIISESGTALAFARCLKEDLGIDPIFISMSTVGEESVAKLDALERELGFDSTVLTRANYIHIRRCLEELQPELVLGGLQEQYTFEQLGLLDSGISFVSIPTWPAAWGIYVSHRPFVGFAGLVNTLETVVNAIWRAPTQTTFRQMELMGDY